MIGINAGSGQRPFDQKKGWINIDIQPVCYEGKVPDIVCDMSSMPFEDNYADYVVSHHTLEHFGCGEGDAFVSEAFRVLKPGGSLIVCVPDMRALAQRYLLRQMDTQLYMTNVYGAYHGDPHDRHYWGYDSGSLHEYLLKWKWEKVKQFDFRPIPGADIAKDFWILGMECVA